MKNILCIYNYFNRVLKIQFNIHLLKTYFYVHIDKEISRIGCIIRILKVYGLCEQRRYF